MGSDTHPVRLFAQDKKVQHSSTALRNVLADKEQTQSKLGATLAAMEEEMAEREAGWEAERGGLQAMLAAKERELVRSHSLFLAFGCVGFRNGRVLTCCLRLAVFRRQCEGPRLRRAGRSQEKSGTPSSSSSSSSSSSFNSSSSSEGIHITVKKGAISRITTL